MSQVTPSVGLVAGGTTVSVIGSASPGDVGGLRRRPRGVLHRERRQLDHGRHAGGSRGGHGRRVANVLGVSAVTPADRFQYLGSVPGSRSPARRRLHRRVPDRVGDDGVGLETPRAVLYARCVAASSCSDRRPRSVRAAPPRSCCPRAGSRRRRPAAAYSASFPPPGVARGDQRRPEPRLVQARQRLLRERRAPPVSPLIAGDQLATAAAAPKAPEGRQKLRACSKKKPVPPCLLGKTVTDGVAHATMLLPATGGTFRVVTPDVKISRLRSRNPRLRAPRSRSRGGTWVPSPACGSAAPGGDHRRTKTKLEVTVPDARRLGRRHRDHAERTGRGAEAVDPAAVTKPRCRSRRVRAAAPSGAHSVPVLHHRQRADHGGIARRRRVVRVSEDVPSSSSLLNTPPYKRYGCPPTVTMLTWCRPDPGTFRRDRPGW